MKEISLTTPAAIAAGGFWRAVRAKIVSPRRMCLRGFAAEAMISRRDARFEWCHFAMHEQLSDEARAAAEAGGSEVGRKWGRRYRDWAEFMR